MNRSIVAFILAMSLYSVAGLGVDTEKSSSEKWAISIREADGEMLDLVIQNKVDDKVSLVSDIRFKLAESFYEFPRSAGVQFRRSSGESIVNSLTDSEGWTYPAIFQSSVPVRKTEAFEKIEMAENGERKFTFRINQALRMSWSRIMKDEEGNADHYRVRMPIRFKDEQGKVTERMLMSEWISLPPMRTE